jgi:protein-tyrosine phosphatase
MGLFSGISGLFEKGSENRSPVPSAGNPITIELHSHLIPAIDDGVQSLEESVELIRTFAEMGYKKVITSPHIMGDFYKNGPHNINPLVETIRAQLKTEGLDVAFESAAEYLIDESFEAKIDSNEPLLTFGGSKKYTLVELPFLDEPRNLKSVFFKLNIAGYQPVLAHPERYLFYFTRREMLEAFYEQGVLFQVNMLSLIGYYSPQVQKTAEWMIENKMVNFVGSDAHNIKHVQLIREQVHPSKLYKKLMELPLLNNEL